MITELIGKTIVAVKGINTCKEAQYILFDDGRTYIRLSEQDYDSYHDCSSSARHIEVNTCDKNYYDFLLALPDATYMP